jgi:hypothetical protein
VGGKEIDEICDYLGRIEYLGRLTRFARPRTPPAKLMQPIISLHENIMASQGSGGTRPFKDTEADCCGNYAPKECLRYEEEPGSAERGFHWLVRSIS